MDIELKKAWTTIDDAADPTYFVGLMDRIRGGKDNDPAQYRLVSEVLDVGEGQIVLDVGCGTGGAAQVFAQRVGASGKIVGIDKSRTMLGEAKKRTANLGLPIEFQQGDAHHLPFPDNYFDRCYSLRLFELIPEPERALKEMFRVTRPGGLVFINGPDVDTWTFDCSDRELTRRIVNYICDKEVNGWIGRQLPRFFGQAGLSDIKVAASTYFGSDFDLLFEVFLNSALRRAGAAGVVTYSDCGLWLDNFRTNCGMSPASFSQTTIRVAGRKI